MEDDNQDSQMSMQLIEDVHHYMQRFEKQRIRTPYFVLGLHVPCGISLINAWLIGFANTKQISVNIVSLNWSFETLMSCGWHM